MLVVLAISKKGVDFKSFDKIPIRIFLAYASPKHEESGPGPRLKMLSYLALFLEKITTRKIESRSTCNTPSSVIGT
jgi:mannitol/fructose-specific phosphotransferase system IIA component (Ntr-type)